MMVVILLVVVRTYDWISMTPTELLKNDTSNKKVSVAWNRHSECNVRVGGQFVIH